MNRYFEEDILGLCKDIRAKLQAAPEMFGAAREEPGKGQLDALRKLMEVVESCCKDLLPRRCHTYGDIRLPWDPEKTRSGLTASLDALNRILDVPKLPPLLLLFREDLEKLRDLLSAARDALNEAEARHDAASAARLAENQEAIAEMQRRLFENGDLSFSLEGDAWDDTGFRRPGEDACREIVVEEPAPQQPGFALPGAAPDPVAAPNYDAFISYTHNEGPDPERLRRAEMEQRILQEETLRQLEELRRSNANMAPPPSAADRHRQAADIGRGITMCPVCNHVLTAGHRFCPGCGSPVDTGVFSGAGLAAASATKQTQTRPEKERKGLFRSLFAPKKNRKKSSKEDEVQFRAAAPTTIRPGEFFPVKMMMFLENDYDRADREQSELGDQVSAVTGSVFKARQDQLFRITLRSPDLPEMNESETLVWNGRFASVYIYLGLPAAFDKKQLRLQGRVYSGDAVVTDLKMLLRVGDPQPQEVDCQKCALRSAFISYASADRAQVVSRIQGIQLAAPDLDLFFDVENLQRGEHWEPRLYKEIEKRDLFYLFWSKNAAASPWVAKELQYALAHKDPDSIEPVPLDPPDECPPPDALRDRHFNDWTLRYRKP